jgi:hypothetical protein
MPSQSIQCAVVNSDAVDYATSGSGFPGSGSKEEIMVLTRGDLLRAEQGILDIFKDSDASYSPARLMERLEQRGIPEYSARVAIWYLIDRNLIELTMDRLLRPARQQKETNPQQDPIPASG